MRFSETLSTVQHIWERKVLDLSPPIAADETVMPASAPVKSILLRFSAYVNFLKKYELEKNATGKKLCTVSNIFTLWNLEPKA